jgi:hypothetical protein
LLIVKGSGTYSYRLVINGKYFRIEISFVGGKLGTAKSVNQMLLTLAVNEVTCAHLPVKFELHKHAALLGA